MGAEPRSPGVPTKEQLLKDARRRGIPGRSKMTKAELAVALRQVEEGPAPSPDERRRLLNNRLSKLVDPARRCDWMSVEGYPCGLPAAVGAGRCVLHGGADIEDMAIPATGSLGPTGWPALFRHVWLASYNVDPLGLDPVIAEIAWGLLNYLYFDYFRVEVEGIEHVPLAGPGVLVSNHGGAALPYDAVMLSLAVANEAPHPRRVRVVATEIFNMLPIVSHLYRKAGAAFASRADAHRILADGHLLGVFPEGERGFMKSIWQAYQLQRFGRGGFVETAQRAGAPMVPVAIVGSEEVHPALFVSKGLARLVRLVFPEQRVDGVAVFLNPIPLPVRWKIRFLAPIDPPAPDSDPLAVLETAEAVKSVIQDNLDEMVNERGALF